MMYGIPRGLMLNNPMNLRISSIPWQGKITPSRDPDFEQFDTALDGIRAGAKNASNYRLDGISTLAQFFARYAPNTENPTSDYISFICRRLAVGPDDPVDLGDAAFLEQLVPAIITFEQGMQPYEADLINQGIAEALAA